MTPYQAKYFAYELTKRCSSDSVEKLAGAVAGAQVDLNPHQVDAALLSDFAAKLKRLNKKTIKEICAAVPREFGSVDAKIPAHLVAARNNATSVMDAIGEIFK